MDITIYTKVKCPYCGIDVPVGPKETKDKRFGEQFLVECFSEITRPCGKKFVLTFNYGISTVIQKIEETQS